MIWVSNSGVDSAIHMCYATASSFTAGPLVWNRSDRAGAKDEYLLDMDGDGRQDMAWTHPAGTNRLFVGLSVMD
ncbi:MAG: hypothetical protein IH621_06260 [Krumholzibacteria bacterium]|nr:hypothetical protein [Candidatus Krumholzibacteria bacterium]